MITTNTLTLSMTLRLPDMSQFDTLIREARRQAKVAGVNRADIATAVRRARDARQ